MIGDLPEPPGSAAGTTPAEDGRAAWSADVVAGGSVALVLIPQSMAYAELAGMPAWHGLYAAAAAPILAAPFVSSRHLQTGPVALTALLTAGALAGSASAGSAEYIGLAALLALVVGVARLAIGLLRWGGVAWLMSQPVLRGFTLGAALLIVASQLPAALGVTSDAPTVLGRARAAVAAPGGWTVGAALLSVLTIGLIVGNGRVDAWLRSRGVALPLPFPGVLVAAVIGILASVAGLAVGPTIGDVPAGLPPLSLDLPWGSAPALIVPGIVIALVGFAEASSIARTFAAEDRDRWDPNREFVSQGAANLAAGIFAGFPVGGSFSRSSLGRLAGARTRWAGAITGFAVLAVLPVAGILAPLPKAVLGATVIGAVAKLLDPRPLLSVWRSSRPQAVVGFVTLGTTLAFAPHVEYGVLAGIVLSLVLHVWRETSVDVPVVADGTTLTVRPAGVLWFGTAAHLEQEVLDALAAHPDADRLVIDLSGLGRIDYSGALVLDRLVREVDDENLVVELCGVPGHADRIVGRVCTEPGAAVE